MRGKGLLVWKHAWCSPTLCLTAPPTHLSSRTAASQTLFWHFLLRAQRSQQAWTAFSPRWGWGVLGDNVRNLDLPVSTKCRLRNWGFEEGSSEIRTLQCTSGKHLPENKPGTKLSRGGGELWSVNTRTKGIKGQVKRG